MRLIVIGLVAVGCWTLAALVAWAVVHVGTRHQMPEEPEDGVQVDLYPQSLTSVAGRGEWVN